MSETFDEEVEFEERLAHIVRVVARGFNRCLSIRLAEQGVTFGQWTFLRILWNNDGLSQRELSRRASVTEPTTHTALQKLESLALISRHHLSGDNRRQYVFLTDEGHRLREELEPLAMEVNTVALAGIDAHTSELVRSALITMYDNLLADEHAAGENGKKVPPTRTP